MSAVHNLLLTQQQQWPTLLYNTLCAARLTIDAVTACRNVSLLHGVSPHVTLRPPCLQPQQKILATDDGDAACLQPQSAMLLQAVPCFTAD